MNTIQYVALLRGINVGGKLVSMAQLRKMLEALGFTNVQTLLNSGNAVFTANEKDKSVLQKEIEGTLQKTFGFPIDTIIRSMSEMHALVNKDPFKGIAVTSQTRLYVTFLSTKPTSQLSIPYETPEKDFKIIQTTDSEVYSVLTISERKGTTDVMKILEKEFSAPGKKAGSGITTRNWNTVVKIAKMASYTHEH